MAKAEKRLTTNAPGDFYVDSTCIDCEACRWIAPSTFDEAGGMSRVHRQPSTPTEVERALMALVACPTASIGTTEPHDVKAAGAKFPDPLTDNVYHLGYHDEASFGAASYLITRPSGNVMIDVPRFVTPLVRALEAKGGVDTLFLTHRDDVAGHRKFREHFQCKTIIHARDAGAGTRDAEILLDGDAVVRLDDAIALIPVPGHTEGSVCLLYEDTYLFTGDHLAFDPELGHPIAFRGACWYDWRTQIRSMERLLEHRFAWILPGHGRRASTTPERMRGDLERCITWMRAA